MEHYQSKSPLTLRQSYVGMHGTSSVYSFSIYQEIGRAIGANEYAIRAHYAEHGTVLGMHLSGVPRGQTRKDLDQILKAEAEAAKTGNPVELPVVIHPGTPTESELRNAHLPRKVHHR